MTERCVVFVDVHNYSIVFNAIEDRYNFLQEMYERLGDIILAHKGEIIKYIGDAILCIFPAEAVKEAVACGLAMRRTYTEMIRRRGVHVDTELEVGIGCGEVALGIFGHSSLRQKDVFGEEINRASTIGHHRGIAVTRRVYEAIKGEYQARQLPDIKVKWQVEPLSVWEIIEGQEP